jgi:2-polyprenyl-6-methoxyphenol hydroxylase-like FAD-dependent oxidoreductase
MNADARFDVAVVGASLAGCATAILLARAGWKVALIERRPDPHAYKVACTHFIQASATPTIRRLGLDTAIEAAGGIRNAVEIRTPWGVIRPPAQPYGDGPAFGYSIRRQTLDPIIRRLALETPGVEPLFGHAPTELSLDGRGSVLRVLSRDQRPIRLRARLVVGADGRRSTVARLAGVPASRRPNRRFAYWAYFRDLPLEHGRFWHLDPDIAYALPSDGGLTLLVLMPTLEHLPDFRADRERAFERHVRALPRGPVIDGAERVSPILGMIDMANLRRPPAVRGVALVGDAALTCDPMPGVGCGWALQSAEWLAHCVSTLPGSLDTALREYAARHRAETRDHFRLITRLSRARPLNPADRLLLAAAARDEALAGRVFALVQRRIHVAEYRSPSTIVRAAIVMSRRNRLDSGSAARTEGLLP